MKRAFLIASAGLTLIAVGLLPALASAHHHGRHHHRRATHARHKNNGMGNPMAPSGENAGTVTSFVEGTLTITLGDGTVVAGKVTDATELKCEAAPPATSARIADHGGSGQDGSGDGSSRGDSSGDGNGGSGPGDQQGDPEENMPPASPPAGAPVPMSAKGDNNDQDGGENNDQDGDDQAEHEGPACDMTALIEGTVVRDAELRLTHAGAVFDEVEIIA